MRQKLNIITLGVADLHKSLEFYEKGLKWKRSDKSNDNIVFFDMGGIILALFEKNTLAEDANEKVDEISFRGITIAYNTKSKEEVEQVLNEVKKLGANITKPAEEASWGGFSGYFKDIDGHVFEVAHNPFADFDENDNLII